MSATPCQFAGLCAVAHTVADVAQWALSRLTEAQCHELADILAREQEKRERAKARSKARAEAKAAAKATVAV